MTTALFPMGNSPGPPTHHHDPLSTPPAALLAPSRHEAARTMWLVPLGQEGNYVDSLSSIHSDIFLKLLAVRPLPLSQINGVIGSKVIREGLADRQMEGQLNHKPHFHNKTNQQKYLLF